ncbi:MAG: membrane protein insertase YidC [Candidatus Omnitrophota bacterium]
MEKRLIIAMALSLLVVLAFQKLTPKPEIRQPQIETSSKEGNPLQGTTSERTKSYSDAQKWPETLTEINTEKQKIVFSDVGAGVKSMSLNQYLDKGEKEQLFDRKRPEERLFSMKSSLVPDFETKKYEKKQGNNFIEYRLEEPGFFEITKKYTILEDSEYIDLKITVKNTTAAKIDFFYDIVGPSGLETTSKIDGRNFLEAITMLDEKKVKLKDAKGEEERQGKADWVGLKNRYFTVIVKPFMETRAVRLKHTMDKALQIELSHPSFVLDPGTDREAQYLLYAGPMKQEELEKSGYGLEKIIDYGFFGVVSKTLLSAMGFFYKITKNWGIAIILLTILINLVLFPLTHKSFMSMHQMRKVQPHIQKLKDLHKDNPHKLNKETMELYRKHNVNPLGGCLPMLIQMPIFIALYQGLLRSVSLKGAKFLWIKDLAKPDAVPLPFSLPFLGDHINILPLVMVALMACQQKISQGLTPGAMTQEQASQQKMMMLLMPLLFGFLFYKMPSGLVLYWVTNTLLMTVEQGVISKKME